MTRILRFATFAIALAFPIACAADYRATGDPATILYDAPSARAKPLFVYGRDVPVEVLVVVEGWTKVRDVSGTIGWIASKSLSDKRTVEVRAPGADVRASPDDSAPVVFRCAADLLLELAEPATSPATASAPGWVKVRHRDGQTGYVRLSQVFGF
ncbi:MAG TPA: SH3 domain-containing protein [Casimicrobiaceae bacterium]|nr:SH3 domain-containing protein [Casimicrobiaceae bacterium]